MSDSFHFQLALQGGGAKIAHLVAALEGIEQACSDVGLDFSNSLTRVAGTSAGSIVTGLISVGAGSKAIRTLIHKLPHKTCFPKLSKRKALPRILFSRPIANFDPISKMIINAVKKTDACDKDNVVTIKKSIHIPYSTFGPQLGTYNHFNFNQKIPLNTFITAIRDSCAIPFYFLARPSDSTTAKLDGGLSNNFPTDLLIPETNQFGPVFAITFKVSDIKQINSNIEYLMNTISIAIDSNTEKNKTPNQNLYIHEIDSENISTFDFDIAIKELTNANSDMLSVIKEKTRKAFLDFYHKYNLYFNKNILHHWFWNFENRHENTLNEIYKLNHHPYKFKINNKTVEFILNSLKNSTKSDQIHEKITFQVIDKPLELFKLEAFDLNLFRTRININRIGSHPCSIPFKCLPSWDRCPPPGGESTDKEIINRGIVIIFTPPLEPNLDNTYEITAIYELEKILPELTAGEISKDSLIVGTDRAKDGVEKLTIIASTLPDCENYTIYPTTKTDYASLEQLSPSELASTGYESISTSHEVRAWVSRNVPAGVDVCLEIARKS